MPVSIAKHPGKLAKRLLKRVHHEGYLRVRRDPVTGRRIRPMGKLAALGSKGGAWTVPLNLLGTSSIVYCVGCGENITFDLALVDRIGCSVFAFDPTPRAIAHVAKFAAGVPKYHFQPIGVWETDTSLKFFEPRDPQHVSHSLLNLQKTSGGFDAQVRRLSNVMRDLGHSHIDLLKLDIEGAEYKVLETIFEDRIDVGVLCVEFDEFFNPLDAQYVKRIDRALGNLERHGFVLAHTTGTANYTFVRSRR